MQSPLLRITGTGKVDLPGNKIDYVAKAAIVGTMEGQGGQSIKDLKNIVIPVKITGSLDDPKATPDVAAILKENLKGQVKDKIKDKIGEKLKGKGLGGALDKVIPGGAGGLLKNVFPF